MNGVQGSGAHHDQGAGFKIALHTGCRVQDCITHKVQDSGVYFRSAGLRIVLCKGFRKDRLQE